MMTQEILIRFFIALLGLAGFLVSFHIYRKKKMDAPLVCPIKFDCNAVVRSNYAKFMGARVEVLGMLYYLLILFAYAFFVYKPEVLSNSISGFVALSSGVAFVFSVYLICVQSFVIRNWCFWCIVSAFVSAAIFVLTLLTYDFSYLFGLFM